MLGFYAVYSLSAHLLYLWYT